MSGGPASDDARGFWALLMLASGFVAVVSALVLVWTSSDVFFRLALSGVLVSAVSGLVYHSYEGRRP